MDNREKPTTLWSALRKPDTGWLPRLAASLISGLSLAAAGLIGVWCFTFRPGSRGYMSDEHLAAGLGLAAVFWLTVLAWIWRGHQSRHKVARAFALTGALGLATGGLCVVIDAAVRFEEEALMTAAVLLAFALAVWLWTPVLTAVLRGRSPRTAGGEIDVTCPTCGYALNGLRDLRCPECGTTFTIDSLIEAQRYDGGGRAPAKSSCSTAA